MYKCESFMLLDMIETYTIVCMLQVDCFSVSGNLFCFGKSNYAANYHSLMVIEEEPALQRNSKKNINFTLNLVRD